jgi:hypothetical protein
MILAFNEDILKSLRSLSRSMCIPRRGVGEELWEIQRRRRRGLGRVYVISSIIFLVLSMEHCVIGEPVDPWNTIWEMRMNFMISWK